jgi:hypothetical protein
VSGDAVHQPTWPLLLKIEHMVKLQVLGNNSKTVNNNKNLTSGKHDQHSKIYRHVGWCTASPDTILKLDTLVMILTKFGFIGLVLSEEKIFDVRRTPDAK